MQDAIYGKSGELIAFHVGKIIYDLQGHPVAQLRRSQVYCMAGHHVGELKNGVILDKTFNPSGIPAHQNVSRRARGTPGMRSHGSPPGRRNSRQ